MRNISAVDGESDEGPGVRTLGQQEPHLTDEVLGLLRLLGLVDLLGLLGL